MQSREVFLISNALLIKNVQLFPLILTRQEAAAYSHLGPESVIIILKETLRSIVGTSPQGFPNGDPNSSQGIRLGLVSLGL